MGSSKATGVARRRDAARSIERILRAAQRLLPQSPSLEDIAQAAGVGVATVYRHFTNRDKLLQAVAARNVVERIAPEVEAASASPSALEGLKQLATRLIDVATTQAAIAEHEASALSAILREVMDAYGDSIAALLIRAQHAGEVRNDLTRDDIGPIVGTMLAGLAFPFSGAISQARYIALTFEAIRPEGANPLPQR